MSPDKVLVEGNGYLEDFVIILTCVECKQTVNLGFSGVGPTLADLVRIADQHGCAAGPAWVGPS